MDTHLNFGWLDWSFIFAYLALLLFIGWWHSRKPKTMKEYFLASKHMSWLPIGLSLMAALNSGMDYMAQPSALMKFGWITLISCLTWLLIYPYAFFVSMPLYRRLDVYSAYEYMERRFNLAVRTLMSVVFILWRLGWMATALYVPALALTSAIGRPDLLNRLILIMGLVATIYTMMGGIKSVIWTEVLQFVVMFAGLALTLTIVLYHIGFDPALIASTLAQAGEPVQFQPKVSGNALTQYFTTPATMTGFFLAAIAYRFTTYTGDQIMVQRFQTAKSIRDVRQGFIITAVSDTVWMVTLIFIGVLLFIYFKLRFPNFHLYFDGNSDELLKQHGDNLPAFLGLPDWMFKDPRTGAIGKLNTDYLFPYFMSKVFPPGLTGPVIAAIVAASLSAIASAINSQSTVIVVDFYNRIVKGRRRPPENLPESEQRFQVWLGWVSAFVVGILGTFAAMQVNRFGTLFEIGPRVIGAFIGPLLGIFWLGMFTRRGNSAGALIGGLVGVFSALLLAFDADLFKRIFGFEHQFSFIWSGVLSIPVTFIVGYVASLLCMFSIGEKARQWNWYAITGGKNPETEL